MKAIAVAAVLAAMVLVGPACGDDDRSDADKAGAALDAGLKAQVDGHDQKAAEHYRKVLALDPKNKFAFYNLGLLDQKAGRTESAVQFYRQALAVDPNYVPALFNLAISVTESNGDEAVMLYRQVLALDSNHAGASLNLGLMLKARGQVAEGENLIQKAILLDPKLATTTTTAAAP